MCVCLCVCVCVSVCVCVWGGGGGGGLNSKYHRNRHYQPITDVIRPILNTVVTSFPLICLCPDVGDAFPTQPFYVWVENTACASQADAFCIKEVTVQVGSGPDAVIAM